MCFSAARMASATSRWGVRTPVHIYVYIYMMKTEHIYVYVYMCVYIYIYVYVYVCIIIHMYAGEVGTGEID